MIHWYKYSNKQKQRGNTMKKEGTELKLFNMRLPKHIWLFLKNTAAAQERSMTDIIVEGVEKYKTKLEKKLTNADINV